MACQACHASKTRCSKRSDTGKNGSAGSSSEGTSSAAPCKRCAKLQIECVPHISRQGKKTRSSTKRKGPPCPPGVCSQNEDGLFKSVDGHVLKQIVTKFAKSQHHPCHYGLRFLLQSWAAISFTRRSFSLLSRASRLAFTLNVPMNDVFPNMPFLRDIVCRPSEEQPSLPPAGTALTWEDIPTKLLRGTNCYERDDPAAPMGTKTNTTRRDDRWIWIRQFHEGQSRYLVSEAFGRDVAPQPLLQRTWDRNEKEVARLFLKEIHPHSKAVSHNIMHYTTERRGPTHCRLKGAKLITHPGTAAKAAAEASKKQQQKQTTTSEGETANTGESGVVVNVDLLAWMYIESFDHAYSFFEYIPDVGVGVGVSGGAREEGISSSVAVEKGGGDEWKKGDYANDHLISTTTMGCTSSSPAVAESSSATTATVGTTPIGLVDSPFLQDLDLDIGGAAGTAEELIDDEYLLSLLTNCEMFGM